MSQTSTTEVIGTGIKYESLFSMSVEVVEVGEARAAKIKVTYDRVKFSMSGFMESDYDSEKDKKPEDLISKMMAVFLGKSYTP